jgi:hypothetical protein
MNCRFAQSPSAIHRSLAFCSGLKKKGSALFKARFCVMSACKRQACAEQLQNLPDYQTPNGISDAMCLAAQTSGVALVTVIRDS